MLKKHKCKCKAIKKDIKEDIKEEVEARKGYTKLAKKMSKAGNKAGARSVRGIAKDEADHKRILSKLERHPLCKKKHKRI